MPKPPLPDELQALLREPNPAVMASLRPDGSPLSVATWYLWEDGRVLVNLDHSRARLEHLRQRPARLADHPRHRRLVPPRQPTRARRPRSSPTRA